MRPYPHLRHRTPEPGLINIPLDLPPIPILSPIITPIIGQSNPNTSPNSNPPPPPAPSPPAPSPQEPSHGHSPNQGENQGHGGGDHGGNSGNANNGGNNGNANSANANNGENSANANNEGSSVNAGNGAQGEPPVDPSQPNSGSVTTAPVSSVGSSSPAVSGGASVGTPTALNMSSDNALANAAPDLSANNPSPNNVTVTDGSSTPHDASHIPAGSQSTSDSYKTVVGSGGNNGGNGSGGGDVNGGMGSTASSNHRISGGAIGGIIVAVLILSICMVILIMRHRHKRRRKERRVEWMNGHVADGSDPEMLQRTSKRSSWGTPFEFRISSAFRRSVASTSPSNEQDYDYVVPSPSLYGSQHGELDAPVLPMPVHSPTQVRAGSPEDPFADATARALREVSLLPLRLSVLSSGSGHEDPFRDENAVRRAETENVEPPHSAATNGTSGNVSFPSPPRVSFPSPPTTTPPQPDRLQAPEIRITFPGPPILPTFAAAGTSSYPHRAIVHQTYTPERQDEVQIQRGDSVSVMNVYEDGWALVLCHRDNKRGLVPLNHLQM